jgi:hypothetical protein
MEDPNKIHFNPALLAEYHDYPKEFVEDIIFRFYPSSPKPKLNRHQIDLFKAYVEDDWISVRSGRGKGKTTGVALLIPHFMVTRPLPRVVGTAPKIDLLNDVLWPEIYKWLAPSPLRELLTWMKEKMERVDNPTVCYAVARTAKNKENLSGYHSPFQLVIADEASGIADEILETAESTQINNMEKKEIKTILISNPTRVTGFFYKTQCDPVWTKHWRPLHFKPTEEEVAADHGAQRLINIYGADHDLVRVNVYGDFPSGNPLAVFTYSEVDDAMNRGPLPMDGVIEMGVDVARMGTDLTSICTRYGYKVFPIETYKKQDTVQTERKILAKVKELREKYNYTKVIRVKIDDSSMGGGVCDHLKTDTAHGLEIVPVIFGGAGNDYYSNTASMMWAGLHDVIGRIELPRDDVLKEELIGRNWCKELDNRSRQKIESKDDMRERIHRSPDRADSVLLCFYNSSDQVKILPKLIHLRKEVYQTVPVRLDLVQRKSAEMFGSVWHDKDLKESCLCGLWEKGVGKLTLWYEGESRFGGPGHLIETVDKVLDCYNKQFHTEYKARKFTWYGNRAMFGLSEGAVTFEHIKDGPYLAWQNEFLVAIQPNFYFDLRGAVIAINKMITSNSIVILPELENLRIQLESWSIDNDVPDNEGRPLCMALANIVSMLVATKRIERVPKKFKEYSGEREKFLSKVEEIFKKGQKDRFLEFLPRGKQPAAQ